MMEKYRVKGVYGNGDIQVFTEWFDTSKAEVMGIKTGLELTGWSDCEIEVKQ